MKVLHILRDLEEALPLEVARAHQDAGHKVTLLLLHDAVLRQLDFPGQVLACRDDLLARGVEAKYPALDYPEMVQLIFQHDRVISW